MTACIVGWSHLTFGKTEDDVEDMLDANERSERFEEEDDGQPSWEQEWADFGEEY